jgi:hypothetical protein
VGNKNACPPYENSNDNIRQLMRNATLVDTSTLAYRCGGSTGIGFESHLFPV